MTTTPDSPYVNLPPERWKEKTRELIDLHPLEPSRIVDVVLSSWDSIFDSTIGTKRFAIGQHIFPKPQIMGFLLHELIPLEFQAATLRSGAWTEPVTKRTSCTFQTHGSRWK